MENKMKFKIGDIVQLVGKQRYMDDFKIGKIENIAPDGTYFIEGSFYLEKILELKKFENKIKTLREKRIPVGKQFAEKPTFIPTEDVKETLKNIEKEIKRNVRNSKAIMKMSIPFIWDIVDKAIKKHGGFENEKRN